MVIIDQIKVYRQWGWFMVISNNDDSSYKVKKLVIDPKKGLSIQKHLKRSEHWTIVNGTANVHVGGVNDILSRGDTVYVPLGVKHTVENRGNIPLEIIEVQFGDYLGEDDIIRYSSL